MHTDRTYEIRFDADDVAPLTVPAPASPLGLAAHAIDHLAGAGAVQAAVELAAGRITVEDDAGTVIAVGRITGPGVGPATWADLSAVTDLLTAGGWTLDYTDDLDGGVEHGYLHPSGREVIATPRLGGLVDVHLTGLDLAQVTGAVTGAGLAPATEVAPAQPAAVPPAPRSEQVDGLRDAVLDAVIRHGEAIYDYVRTGHAGADRAAALDEVSRRLAEVQLLTRALADLATQGGAR